MINKISELLKYVEDYLKSRPLVANIIVDKYEIVSIYNIGEKLVGATGVGESICLDVKIKGTFASRWEYLYSMEVMDYYGISLYGRGVKKL